MSITKYQALLVSDKTAAQNLMNIFLKEAGIAGFNTAQSLREAVSIAKKELPHLIVCYDDLPDANTIQVIEALRGVPLLEKALIFVMRNSTQTEIMQLMKLKITAMVSKDIDPNIFIEKVKQKLTLMHGISPFSIRGEELVGGSQVTVKAATKILGRHEGHVVCSSQIEAQSGAILNVQPSAQKSAPFAVTFAGASPASKTAKGHENLFSMNEVVGKGRQWLQENTPVLDSAQVRSKKKLLVLDTKADRIKTLSKAISIHEIETEHVPDYGGLISKYQASPQTYGAVLFLDPPDATAAASWEKTKQTLAPDKRPIELVATFNSRLQPSQNVVWLQKPFTLDLVIQSFRAAVASQHKAIESTSPQQISAQYIVQAKITSLDETGGILQAPIKPDAGTELELDNPFLNKIPFYKNVRVVATESSPHNQKIGIIRFQVIDAGVTKEKLYTTLLKTAAESKSSGGSGMPTPGSQSAHSPTTPKVTSLAAAAAQSAAARPLWSTQKSEPMPKFNVPPSPKKP